MRFLVPFLLCLLVSCSAIQGTDDASLVIEEKSVVFSSGASTAGGVRLFLFGGSLRFNDPSCVPSGRALECNLGSAPAGRVYRVSVVGVGEAQVFYSKNGVLRFLEVRK